MDHRERVRAARRIAAVMLEPGGQQLSILDIAERAEVGALWLTNILAEAMLGVHFDRPESAVVWGTRTESALRAVADIDDLEVLRWRRGEHVYEVLIGDIAEVTAHHEKVEAPDGEVLVDDVILTLEHVSGHFDEIRADEGCFAGVLALLRVQLGVPRRLLDRVEGGEAGLSLVLWPASDGEEERGDRS